MASEGQRTYRVVGVRADGTERILCDGIPSEERAEHLAKTLQGDYKRPFAEIVVEPDSTSPDAVPPSGAQEIQLRQGGMPLVGTNLPDLDRHHDDVPSSRPESHGTLVTGLPAA